MTNRKHPPGPWRVIHNKRHNSINVMTMPDDEGYCEKIALINGRDEAVAQLIAALPDTLVENTRLREENARLREAVKNAYYEGWQDSASQDYSRQEIHKDWETSEACAAIREGGKDAG